MAITINSAADARYYAAKMNASKSSRSTTTTKKSSSSLISGMTKMASSLASTVKKAVTKNSSAATTATKKPNTSAAVKAASTTVKSKTNQNKKTTTTVSSAVSKVASSISKAVKTATNAIKTAAQNIKTSTNAKAAAASTTKTASKNTTNARTAAATTTKTANTSSTKKNTASKSTNNSNIASRIINIVNTAASNIKKAPSATAAAIAAERARQEAAARAKAEEQAALARAAAMSKSRPSAKSTTSAAVNSTASNNTAKKSTVVASTLKNTNKTTPVANTMQTTKGTPVTTSMSNTKITIAPEVNTNTTQNTTAPKSEACKTSLSMALTGKHSEGLEHYLNNLEKQYGTNYISENIFKNDVKKYNPEERDMQLWVSPQIKFTNVNSKTLSNEGINLNDIKTSPNSTVKEAGIYSAPSYTVVHNNSPLAEIDGYITEYEYNHLVATVAGEAGAVSASNSFGVVSAALNAAEEQHSGDIMEFLKKNCWRYGKNYKWYVDTEGKQIISGNGTENGYNNAKIAVDIALSGTRAFPKEVQFWVGNWQYLQQNNLLDQYDSFNKFSTTHEETIKYVE